VRTRALVTLVVGSDYESNFERYCRKNWTAYADRAQMKLGLSHCGSYSGLSSLLVHAWFVFGVEPNVDVVLPRRIQPGGRLFFARRPIGLAISISRNMVLGPEFLEP
jgi:hypothetical protein